MSNRQPTAYRPLFYPVGYSGKNIPEKAQKTAKTTGFAIKMCLIGMATNRPTAFSKTIKAEKKENNS